MLVLKVLHPGTPPNPAKKVTGIDGFASGFGAIRKWGQFYHRVPY